MYERLLLESGKMFKGRGVSGIGADVVDDSRTILIPVSIPEGKAEIVSFTVPPSFTPGVPFAIGATIRNIGTFIDDLFVRVTDTDTNTVMSEIILPQVAAGATRDWSLVAIVLIQMTDFHGLFQAGHLVNGSKVVDDSRNFTIPVLIPEGIAAIVSVSAPETFTPGVSFTIGIMIKNVGTFADRLFVRITNIDTGEVLGVDSMMLNAGETSMPIPFPVTLPQMTDFHCLIEAGHIED